MKPWKGGFARSRGEDGVLNVKESFTSKLDIFLPDWIEDRMLISWSGRAIGLPDYLN